jgi:hypothetical protein
MRKSIVGTIVFGLLLGMIAPVAHAATSGSFSSITLEHGGSKRTSISNNFIKVEKPKTAGDRVRWSGTLKDLNSEDKDDATGAVQWWANGNRCYLTSVTTANGVGVSQECSNGWKAAQKNTIKGTSSTKGVTRTADFYYDGTDGSARVGIKACRDRGRLLVDPCTDGWRQAGVTLR